MFENVVLAQKFDSDRVSSASISKTVRTFAYRAKFQIRIFWKYFQDLVGLGKDLWLLNLGKFQTCLG